MKSVAMLPLVLVAVAGIGCGGAARPPVAAPSQPAAGGAVPAAHYAALFAPDTRWTYQVVSESSMSDPGDPKADKDGMVKERTTSTITCHVAEVRAWKRGVASRVECDAPLNPNDDPLAGVWVADPRGLFHPDEDLPAAGADLPLADARLVIAAAPRAGKDEKKGTGDEEGFGESTEIAQKDGAWCVTYASWGGDESYETLCFAASGIVKGGSGWAGGSVHDTTFELVR